LTWPWSSALVVAASSGVILAAAYMLWMIQRVLYGEVANPKNAALPDLSLRESLVLAPLVALALVMGVASPLFTRSIEPSVSALLLHVRSHARPPAAAPLRAGATAAPAEPAP
jgi:NADH-quinone oxidoreductase subunit M